LKLLRSSSTTKPTLLNTLKELRGERKLNLEAIKMLEYNQAYLAKYTGLLKKEIAWMKAEVKH